MKSTFGNEELLKNYQAFAEKEGSPDMDINSEEGREIKIQWLLETEESSPELNNETLIVIEETQQIVRKEIKEGNKEESLIAIQQLKQLLSKLETGIGSIE